MWRLDGRDFRPAAPGPSQKRCADAENEEKATVKKRFHSFPSPV
jgi:hypothetical protein